jgi:hypothetical protein
MSASFRTLRMLLCVCAVTLLATAGYKNEAVVAAAQSSGSDLSGPPKMSVKWGTRLPRECAQVTTPPNAAQAVALVQCTMEAESRDMVILIQDVKVQMGGARPFGEAADTGLQDLDVSAKIIPLRGSQTMYQCGEVRFYGKGTQCSAFLYPKSEGRCWKTKFGDWKCNLAGGPGAQQLTKQPGPVAY